MSIPNLLIGLILSTLLGAAFHLWRGGGLIKLILFILLSWLGFWIGHFAAARFGLTFFNLGALNLGMAVLVSLIFLSIGQWLSPPAQPAGPGKRRK